MANPVQKAPWKIPFDVSGSGPYVVRVKLSDLLFQKPDPNDASTWIPYDGGGFRLPHDIFLYDPSIFQTNGALMPSVAKHDRQKKGFFLTRVTYDARAKRTWIADPYYKNQVPGQETGGYYVYDSSAALTPTDESDYRSREKTYNLYLPPAGSEYALNDDYYTQSCTVGVEGTQLENTADLILANRDEALEATLPGSSLIPYTRIRLNSDETLQEPYRIIRYFTDFGVGDDGENSVKSVNGSNVTVAETFDPTINVRLQDVELWLRCAFFADYVDPSSYDQDLHGESDVKHRNLILGAGDFDRYSREASTSEVRPYIPATPPREDAVTQILVSNGTLSAFPIPPKAGEYNNAIDESNIPIGWRDPDIEGINDDMSHGIPPHGNVYTSGRIFSPTVDELWTYIKKAVSGRAPDSASVSYGTPKSGNANTQYNEADTRLSGEPSYVFPSGRTGDPLNHDGTQYVNTGEGVAYALNTNIVFVADKITSGIDSQEYSPILSDDDQAEMFVNRSRAIPGVVQSNERWGLRDQPLSLRELEALILNERYNLEVAFNFIANNKVSTGNTDTEEVSTHGTLYQLHRDFHPDLDARDPNSKWMGYSSTEQPSEGVYGESLPTAQDGYNRQTDIAREDVYLSAEGKWRYLFDHVRVPVLDEQY